MAKWVFLNDDLIEEEKATVHFKDLAFQRGYGVFDFFRIHDNKPLFLNDHLDRFYASACGLHLPIAGTRQQLAEKIEALVSKNGQPDSVSGSALPVDIPKTASIPAGRISGNAAQFYQSGSGTSAERHQAFHVSSPAAVAGN
jgi:branched-subunit amino acid aminotransferase/4-amino-4-deoxychorismate lyase